MRHGEDYIEPGTSPGDDWGHGTHIGGTVAARRDVGVSTGVVGTAPGASLLAYKVKGLQQVDLEWSGTTANVDILRDGARIAENVAGSTYTDHIDAKGGGSYTYKVCETGTFDCSNEAGVTF